MLFEGANSKHIVFSEYILHNNASPEIGIESQFRLDG